MTEALRNHSDDGIETPPSNVIRLELVKNPDMIDPNSLTDYEITWLFLSQASHPSLSDPKNLSAKILQWIEADDPSKATEQQAELHHRFQQVVIVEASQLGDDDWDTLRQEDKIFGSIVQSLHSSSSRSRGVIEERAALRTLLDVRASVVNAKLCDETSDMYWRTIVARLAG